MRHGIEHALTARRRSRRVEFRDRFDARSDDDWCELIRDIVALANSGGGVVIFTGDDLAAVSSLDGTEIAAQVGRFVETDFADFRVTEAARDARRVIVLTVGEARVPMVFSKPGCAPPGTVYFRHGAKSRPATTEDIAAAMDRRANALRRSWLTAMKRVVEAPEGFFADDAAATPIRVVEDPRAPAYRVVDYDKTHPYRQKEVLATLRQRFPGRPLNQFDLLAIRHVHGIDERPEFSHKSMYGTRQYSQKFLDWLTDQAARDAEFFDSARAEYSKHRAADGV